MEKRICNELTGISYTLQGDYYLPDLGLPEQEDKPIGVWGQRHLRYIKQHRKILYINLLTSGELNGYLADIDELSNSMYENMITIYQRLYGVTEELKKSNPIEWIRKNNIIINSVNEVICNDVISR